MTENLLLLVLLSFCVYLPHYLSQSATLSGGTCTGTTRKTLKLLTILPHHDILSSPMVGPSWDKGMIDLLSLKLNLFVERINDNPDVLPCHKLLLVYKTGGCDDGLRTTLESLASGLFPQDRSEVVGILGTGCAHSATESVKLASRPEIQLVVVHNGGSLTLENYKNSIGMLGSSRSLIDLSLVLIKKNKWQNVHVLYEDNHPYYREMKDHFLVKLTHEGVTATLVSPVYSYFYPLNEIRSSRVRIVFVFASLKHLRRILCLAYDKGLVYPAYQWVILSHTLSGIATYNVSFEHSFTFSYNKLKYTCTNVNLTHALEKMFFVSLLFHANTQGNNIMYFNESSDKDFLWDKQTNLVFSFCDALYAWVSALHNLTVNYPDIEFNYKNSSLVELITEQFFKLTFEGVTGRISFNSSTGFANRPANIYQISSGREMIIGSLNSSRISMLSSFSHISDQFRTIALPQEGVTGFFIAAQLVELFVIIILHILTFMYRKTKSIKATSPKLVHLAFVGGYIFIATLMTRSIGWTADFGPIINASLCQMTWAWGLPLSFTLTLGIVTMRTWRLYRIFVHYLDPGKFLSNPALTLAVLLLASVDVAIAIIWTTVDPMKLVYKEIMVKIGSQYEVFLKSECVYNLVWLVLLFLFKLVLLVALIVLTVLTRKIPNATFTTGSLKVFSYSFSTLSVLGFGIHYLLTFTLQHPDPHAEFITLSSLLNIQLVLFVAFIIAPPLVPILLKKIKKKNLSKF